MESQHLSSTIRLWRMRAGHSTSLLAVSLGVAALLFTGRINSQTRIAVKAADKPGWRSGAEPTVLSDAAIQAPVPPAPQVEEANIAKPPQILSLALQSPQNANQSSSSASATQTSSLDQPVAATSTKAAASRSKPPHHGLGIALATIGTTALAAGAIVYAGSKIDICSNEHSGGCQEARDAGLVLMPAGGAVAVAGFYLQFHR